MTAHNYMLTSVNEVLTVIARHDDDDDDDDDDVTVFTALFNTLETL